MEDCMEDRMKVSDVMSTGAAKVLANSPLSAAVEMMVQYRISGLPVVDESGKLVGVITEGDFLGTHSGERQHLIEIVDGSDLAVSQLRTRSVQEIMTKDPVTVDIETSLEEAIETMKRHNVKRLPVLDQGRIAGIFSRSDVMTALFRKAQIPATRQAT